MTNIELMKEVNIKSSTFYALKKRNPRQVELLKKGLEYEKILKQVKDKK